MPVPTLISAVLRWAGRFPRAYLATAMMLEAVAGSVVCHGRQLDVPLIQFELGARELVNTGKIHSTFLPVGYPALLGWAEIAGAHFPSVGPNNAILAMQVALMVLLVLLARTILRQFGSDRFATTGALLIGLDPQLMTFVKSVTDTNLTVVVLFALTATLLLLREHANTKAALLVGLALAAAVQVRPNLLLMAALLVWALWGQTVRVAGIQATVVLSTAALTYVLFASVVHGQPFYPQNGPYNLYAGYNGYTANALTRFRNAENSIPPAMRQHGISVTLDWSRQPDQSATPDPRDAQYIPFYERETRAYIRAHPASASALAWQKFATLFYESYQNHEHRGALFFALTLAVKTACLLIAPIWGLLIAWVVIRRLSCVHGLFLGAASLYVLPFILTNSDPRFRIPLEAVLLLDSMRMLYACFWNRTSLAHQHA